MQNRTIGRRRPAAVVAGGLALLAAPFAAYVATTWYSYGRPRRSAGVAYGSALIERFMPIAEVSESHQIDVQAPASFTFDAARDMDVNRSSVVRAIFAIRTLPTRLRGRVSRPSPAPLLAQTLSLGWRILAQSDHEVVVGAVTQPWRAEVRFRGVEPDAFAGFDEPGYAKIAWTLEVEPLGEAASRFRTRTRVATTDPESRARFRRYWAVFSPWILLIRRESLKLVKTEAERRFRAATSRAATSRPELPRA